MISQSAQYALRAAAQMVTASDACTVDSLAAVTGIPRGYLAKVLHALARTGLLTAQRGTGGGYRLAGDPAQTTALQVIRAIDPPPRRPRCAGCTLDSVGTECAVHRFLDRMALGVEEAFAKTTLAELARS
jgi:Rrf2 family protein